MADDCVLVSPVRSAPSYIGLLRCLAAGLGPAGAGVGLRGSWLARGGQQWRAGVSCLPGRRNAFGLRPPLRSTVMATTVAPCRSALSTWCLATSNLLVA